MIGRALLLLLLLALEAALAIMLTAERIEPAIFAAVHGTICAAIAVPGLLWARTARQGTLADRATMVGHCTAWTLLAGPFGVALCLVLLLPERRAAPRARAGEPGDEPTRTELVHGRLLDGRLRLAGAHRTRPLFEVMLEGRLGEKFDALGLLARHYVPAMAPALWHALRDGDASVRVLAATVMARQHNVHTTRIGALQAAAGSAPGDAAGWRALGAARLAYAESGLLAAARADAEASQARDELGRAERLGPDGC